MAIEAAVPLGKKVRLGEGGKAAGKQRKKKEKRARSKSKSPTKSRTTEQEATRAERLAANLGDLLIDLPTTSGEAASPATAAVDLSDVRRRSSRQESPTTKSPAKSSRSRHHKSLSPDKTKAAIR